jgi:hypothetical protein
LALLVQGRGKAAEFASEGGGARLVWFVIRAHVATAWTLPSLLAKRRSIRSRAKVSAAELDRLLHKHWITPKQVAAH